jgi:phospho-N-acetylmuramoyl-pentapeptide-transferase
MTTLFLAGTLSFIFSLFMTPVFIRIFKRIGWGQAIFDGLMPDQHRAKKGTPTMGGIVVITAVLLGYFLSSWITQATVVLPALLVLFMMVGLGIVGFIDDYIKTRKQRSMGLGAWSKIVGQVIVAIIFIVLGLSFPDVHGVTPIATKISFIRDLPFDFLQLGAVIGLILFGVFIVLIVTSTSNAVNLTDGQDGLATGSSIFAIGAFVIICFWQFNQSCFRLSLDPSVAYKCYEVRDPIDLAIVAAAIVGALIGFLWWNTSPAQIFLGDTGSMALGGALAALAILSHTELLLPIIAGLFVMDTGSVILQLTYFKLTKGKRIFLMSPIHHHFEGKGWAEWTVVVRFWIVAGLCVAVGVGLFYVEWLYR